MTSETTPTRRAVVLVGGAAAPYSRSLRIARALAAEGYNVEIAAVAVAGLPDREAVEGPVPGTIELRRYRPRGPLALIGRSNAARAWSGGGNSPSGPRRAGVRLAARLARLAGAPILAIRRWLLWPHTVRGWWAALDRELQPADLYHACGSLTIAAALAARERHPSGSSRGPIRVIYDAVDDVAESNEVTAMPAVVRRRIRAIESGWARSADAVVTVNEALADRLAARWRLKRPIVVVSNAPEPPDPGLRVSRPDHLRREAGLGPATRLILFQGRLGPNLGLESAAEAILGLPDAALVILGFGRGLAASRDRDREPRYAGRHITLEARHPDELLAWTASADVALIPLPPTSINQRLSTPNKFWEALAAGTPVVVVAGLEVMERIVREHDLGAVAASVAPADLATALGEVLDRQALEGEAWRERIARTSADRFGWPAMAAAYRALVRSIQPPPMAGGG